jgi:hypothetical protein
MVSRRVVPGVGEVFKRAAADRAPLSVMLCTPVPPALRIVPPPVPIVRSAPIEWLYVAPLLVRNRSVLRVFQRGGRQRPGDILGAGGIDSPEIEDAGVRDPKGTIVHSGGREDVGVLEVPSRICSTPSLTRISPVMGLPCC